ncbi:hypothetical protein H257_13720 [Aphanomyces astaci]|uniref:t-SNARE coiled-coil homology domain-containing protein n=1 Tax=Aphanomyces astaci TaxID=112090 RepID=W4FVZ3_APHAT|nr:hypothetical protein H257_13720 [Aphanomyces astaci]ETV70989.1 hypothetical protein H257_13720 [Aphanomyces astaci]|eukprot:XP_009839652.1 hypothetical protein H257_13720 [Aphanomyces astaci]
MEDLNGPAVGDDDEDLQPKPEPANNSPTRRGGCQIAIGRAWPNGPAIDVDHYEFTAADYVRRKGVVAALRERMRVNSLPGCEHFPTRKRTLRTAAEKYTRCNLYFLPFVKTTLPDAVWDGDLVNVARLLVLRIPPDSRDKDGRLALSIAIQLKHSAIAKFLIDKHAKPDLQDQGTLHGALHMCIIMGNKAMTRRLVESGANVELRDAQGMTPLIWATVRGFLEVVGLLLHHGADVNGKDNEGMTALHVACFKGYTDLVDFLLHTGHADLEAEDINGFTPGLYARIEDQGEVLDRIDEFVAGLKKDDERRHRRIKRRAERLARLAKEADEVEVNSHSLI